MNGHTPPILHFIKIASLSAALIASHVSAETPRTSPTGQNSVGSDADAMPSVDPSTRDPLASATISPEEIQSLLPLLLALSEQKQLGTELQALLQSGDMKAAKKKLDAAVEVGTSATLLLEWLHHPALLTALQALPKDPYGPTPALASKPPEAARSPDQPDLTEALNREKSHAVALAADLDAARTELATLRMSHERDMASAAAANAALTDTMKRHEERAEMAGRGHEAVARELAQLKLDVDQQRAAAAVDIERLTAAVRREKERADASERQVASVMQELERTRQERMESATGASVKIAALEKALAAERVRNATALQELASISDALRALQVGSVTPRRSLAGGTPPDAASPIGSLHTMAPVLHTGTIPPPANEPSDPLREAFDTAQKRAEQRVAAPTPPAADDSLTRRADELFRSGDIAGARLLLERAVEGGDVRALFLLAETFDPNALSAIGAVGIRGDPAKARELYGRALALGNAHARMRMEALN